MHLIKVASTPKLQQNKIVWADRNFVRIAKNGTENPEFIRVVLK